MKRYIVELSKGSSIQCKLFLWNKYSKLDMLTGVSRYWSRRFKEHMDKKRAARMSAIPQLNLPEIFVDSGDANAPKTPVDAPGEPGVLLTVGSSASLHNRSAWSTDTTAARATNNHPLSLPRLVTHGISPPGTPSAASFDIARSDGQSHASGEMSRRGSNVSPSQARDMLDDSVWVQSIRKSKTLRKADRTSYRYGDIG